MLRIVKSFSEVAPKDSRAKMLEAFLSSVLIEVVAENYRYLMHEMAFSAHDAVVDPPLRANERVLSGLFATAISRVSPRSRPEVRIDRSIEDDESLDDNEEKYNSNEGAGYSAGRVDYLAWYGDHTIALELKVVQANIDNPSATQLMKSRWGKVKTQAESAQNFLRSNHQYPESSSIALLVIIGRRAVSDMTQIENRKDVFLKEIENFNKLISTTLNPELQVNYIVPNEFRASRRKRKGQAVEGVVYTPIISFIASQYK